jgi:DUF4097 and DUF4098 domain-containing protein YvlB
VRVEASDDVQSPTVTGGRLVTEPDGTVVVEPTARGNGTVVVRCPSGCDVVVATSSGDVELLGQLGDARVVTSTGRIDIEHVQSLDVRTGTGALHLARSDDRCSVVSASGAVHVASANRVEASCQSGRIEVGRLSSGELRTMSGTITVAADGTGDLDVRSASGSVLVEVTADAAPDVALSSRSGTIDSDLPARRADDPEATPPGATALGADIVGLPAPPAVPRIEVRTASGSIRVRRA